MVEQGRLFGIGPAVSRRRRASLTGSAINKGANLVGFGIAALFFWFGIIKLTGVSPVVQLLRQSVPFMVESPYIQLLGLLEVLIGLGLMVDRLSRPASALIMLNIACTLGIILLSPALVFAADTHELTPQGSFLMNYIIAALAGLLFVSWRQRRIAG